MCTGPFEGQQTFYQCLSSSSFLCVLQSPNMGSLLLFDAFKTAFDSSSYHAAAWSQILTPPFFYASFSDGHHRHTSRSPVPLDLPCLARRPPLTLDLPTLLRLQLGHQHLYDHSSLLANAAL